MYVPNFCTSETEFLASESVRMNRYVGPRCDFVFKLLQVLHRLKLQWLLFSMTECDRSIQLQHPSRSACELREWNLGFQAMATRPLESRSLIDEFLPNHDFNAAYEILINAPTSVVYPRLLVSDFNEAWIVRLLMTLRSGRRVPRNRVPGDLHQRLQGPGFVT